MIGYDYLVLGNGHHGKGFEGKEVNTERRLFSPFFWPQSWQIHDLLGLRCHVEVLERTVAKGSAY